MKKKIKRIAVVGSGRLLEKKTWMEQQQEDYLKSFTDEVAKYKGILIAPEGKWEQIGFNTLSNIDSVAEQDQKLCYDI